MMSYDYIWTQPLYVFASAGKTLKIYVRKLLVVCLFGIHKYLSLIVFRTLGEYV